MVDDWGTARERQRKRRRWTWVAVAAVVMIVAPLVAALLLGVLDGMLEHAPGNAGRLSFDSSPHLHWIGLAFAMPLVIAIQYRLWRHADEVERGQINVAFAMFGVVAFMALPVLALAQKPLGIANPAMIGWSAAVVALIATRIVQRLRG